MGHRPVGPILPPLRREDGGLMARKRKQKVKLPTDRTGAPIHIDDVLEWEDDTRLRVDVLSWYGGNFWTAEDDNGEFSDNLGASIIVWRGKGK